MPKCNASCLVLSTEEQKLFPPCSGERCQLMTTYLALLPLGETEVRDMILRDIRVFQTFGAQQSALNLMVVLLCFLARFPQANDIVPPGARGFEARSSLDSPLPRVK
jgi:hypothetical protein